MIKMSGLTLELARKTGRSETLDTWLDKFGEDLIDELLLDTMELERFEQGPGNELCSYLDSTIELDEDLQFLRLSAGYSGRPSRKMIKYRCQLANESESFYRCISVQEQWLRTVIQPQKLKPNFIEIHSNVVPRQAYLTRLAGMNVTCLGDQCSRGFFPTSILREAEPPRQCCRNCTLVEQLGGGAHMGAAVVRFWEFQEENVFKLVDDHGSVAGKGNEGEVNKILWRKGIFARKRFNCDVLGQNLNFSREILVAMGVSHPNIVHYFGYSLRPDNGDYCDLFMELLEGDLENHLTEGDRSGTPLSFQDLFEVLLQIAEAMKHLHEKNFVHGDLKPGNILVSKLMTSHSDVQFYLIKVADFGCAQLVDSNSGASVEPFDFRIGTLHYTAPEVLRCRRHAGASLEHPQKIDVYSFGVIAYQVLTGVTKVYPKVSGIRKGVIEGSLRPDYNLCLPTLDDDRSSLLPLIRRCWAPNPEDRPSFADICSDIIENDHRLRGKNAKRKHQSIGEANESIVFRQQRFPRSILGPG